MPSTALSAALPHLLTPQRDASNKRLRQPDLAFKLFRSRHAGEGATSGVERPAASPLYVLRGVGKRFSAARGEAVALADIDLVIHPGEIFGIIGRSGAGKSTLLRTLNLLETPSAGHVEFEGADLAALPAAELRRARRRIGMIFQHFNLLSSRTVAANIALPLELAGASEAEIRSRVDTLLDLVGLAAVRDRYPAQISGGQKQRVGIARALANDPHVLLCDEATSALDPETTQSILELLRDIQRRLKLTIVLVTHQMQVIKAIADRVAVMESGRIVELGEVAEVFTAPRQEITRTLLREVIGGELPAGVQSRVARLLAQQSGRVWRIGLRGDAVDAPLLAEITARYGVGVHVLHGYIDDIHGTPFASLVVTVTGDAVALASAETYLRDGGVTLEELSVSAPARPPEGAALPPSGGMSRSDRRVVQ